MPVQPSMSSRKNRCLPTVPYGKFPIPIISPHVGGVSTQYNNRAVELFCTNIRRYLDKAPLFNRFDPEKGY